MPDLSHWLTEPEAAKLLEVSERTLRRMGPKGPARRMRPVPGKKSQAVYDPDDVERMRPHSSTQVMVPGDKRLPSPGLPPTMAPTPRLDLAPFVGLLERITGAIERRLAPDPEVKLWMTPKEAGAYLGLTEGLIRRLIRTGRLKCLRDGQGYKVAKAHLDNLDTAAELAKLSKLQQSTADLRQVVNQRRASA